MKLIAESGNLTIDFSTMETILAFKGAVTIPISHIVSVSIDPPKSSWLELRAPGAFFPGIIKAGTYYTSRGRELWYATGRSNRFLIIELVEEKYKRIVLTLDNNQEWADKIAKQLSSR